MNDTQILSPSERILLKGCAGYKFLKRLKEIQKPIIAIDISNALTASIVHSYNSSFFESSWISSLGFSLERGFEDAYTLSPRDYMQKIQEIKLKVPEQFLIVDADNGGQSYKNTEYAFELYGSLGVHLAFVENKSGVKCNSLAKNVEHTLEKKDIFTNKINAAIKSQNHCLVGIRIEDAIVNDDNSALALREAIDTVGYYMEHSKPDFFLFHWKKEDPTIPLEFAKEYKKRFNYIKNLPHLACVPTTYSKNISNLALYNSGYKVIIYGNPLLRTHIQGVLNTLEQIEKSDSLKIFDQSSFPLKELMKLNGKVKQ